MQGNYLTDPGGASAPPAWTFPTVTDPTKPAVGRAPANSNDIISQLQGRASHASGLSLDFGKQGQDLLGPAAEYLKAILGGDRQETLQATMPERRRVIDQYSAAKKALAEFSPRSGGTAGATNKLQAQESSDLAGIVPQARQNAVQTATGAGLSLDSLGLSAEQLASGDLNAILAALTQKDATNAQTAAGFGQALGSIIPLFFL